MSDHTPTQPETKEISLTQGKVAIVDASDYDMLMQFKWFANKSGRNWYAARNVPRGDGRQTAVKMHVMLLGKGVDHKNGDGLDNRRINLRLATQQQNGFNQKPQVGGTSAFKGVAWNKRAKKWMAQIQFNGKHMHIGYFEDELKAATAYDIRARELFGEFAWLNFDRHIYPAGNGGRGGES